MVLTIGWRMHEVKRFLNLKAWIGVCRKKAY